MPRTFAEVEHDLHKAHRHNYLYHTFATVVCVQSAHMLDTLRQAGASEDELADVRNAISTLKQQAYAIEGNNTIDVQPLCDELGRAYDEQQRARRQTLLEVSHA